MTVKAPGTRRDDMRSVSNLLELSFAMWGGLLAWTVHLVVGLGLVGFACSHDALWTIHVLTAVTAAVAVAATAAAVRIVRAARGSDAAAWTVHGREAFMGVVGALLSGIGLWLILFEGIPAFFVSPCG